MPSHHFIFAIMFSVATTTLANTVPANASELQRHRDFNRMPPATPQPTPTTLGCYDQLGKVAHFTPLPSNFGPAECDTPDLVRLDRIIMNDMSEVTFSPAPIIRCGMAEVVAQWVRNEVGPLAAELGSPLSAISNLASYECRGRNRVIGAKLSEHGKGNALDVDAVKLRSGATYSLIDPQVSKPFREQMSIAACRRFTTVLGPGSDAYHSDHIHLDLRERSHGYRICQWNVLDRASVAAEVPLPPRKPAALLAAQSKSRNR